MWFTIYSMSSDYKGEDGPPYPGAVKRPTGRAYRVDRRSVDDPAKVPCERGETAWWYASGTNHRIDDGNICRDIPTADDPRWMIHVPDLDALVAMSRKYTLMVRHDRDELQPHIEVQD